MELGPLRVLSIENDMVDAELNLLTLTHAGFDLSADVITTPVELACKLRSNVYDVILADYRLLNWTGMDAFEELTRLGIKTPFILVSGTLGEESAVECLKQGVTDYVLKGNLVRLPSVVQRAIDDHRAREERDRAHEMIIESEERFRQIAENTNDVFFVMEASFGRALYISPAYERVWGKSCASLYAEPRSFIDPVADADKPRILANMARAQGGEPDLIEFDLIRPDGEVRRILSQSLPIRDKNGSVYRISGLAQDITERRRAEERLREGEERYRLLVESSFDAIDITVDGVILEANRGFVEIFGYPLEEVIGRPVTDFADAESVEMIRRRVDQNIEGTYSLVGRHKEGRKILLEATARSHTINGRPGRITALRDVTEKHLLEDQFRQAQKMEAVGRLAGGVAHDFNNLLTVITSFTALLLEAAPEGDPNREDLNEIRKAADGAAALTRQLLAFSRQQVIEPKLAALGDIVRKSEKMLQRLVGDDIELVAVVPSAPISAVIDPGLLEQVIMNLTVNASDAMPEGGKLTIELSRVDLDESYARTHWPAQAGRYAVLCVSDTGTGMDEKTRVRIFEPFFTTKEAGKGTGLGLATVYGIVKQSGGFIWVYSEPGNGATFKLYFPLADKNAEPTGETIHRPIARGTESILLAEDSPAVRLAARQILERHGYTVYEAANGKEALTVALRPITIDLLLTDVVMPEMSGRELAEQYTALRPDVKVLYISGYTDDAVLRHGRLRPGIHYLQKPFSSESLTRKVRDVLDAVTAL